MNLNDYQEKASRTANDGTVHTKALCQYAMGLSGEAGETTDAIKKAVFHGHELDPKEVAKELGDVLWYVSQLARVIGYTLEEVAEMNVNKLYKRYPNGFEKKASVDRDE